ncbi:MAG: exonuclease SbcD [Cognaticolwellia sp.]|jgi:exonuclease SbcD
MLRVIHTADWHLGHTLYDYDRSAEHQRFLDWLVLELDHRAVDVLLIAGDVFETANPPVSALRQWYSFLAKATARCPKLEIVAIGGNHDSAARLDAPEPLLSKRVHVIGGLPRRNGRELHMERMVLPLHNAKGICEAWIAAIPYLRVSDLPRVSRVGDQVLTDGVHQLHKQIFERLFNKAQAGQATLAMGHLYMQNATLSPDSERKVLGGNQNPLAKDLFPDRLAYVALGHLHYAQEVGRESIRYSGSPIPLSMTERNYMHQVVVLQIQDGELKELDHIPIPRSVRMIRLPDDGYLPLEPLLKRIAELPDRDLAAKNLPYLELRVSLPSPEPTLRTQIEGALESKAVRLLAVRTEYTGGGKALADHSDELGLLEPEQVFRRAWQRAFEGAIPEEILAGFHELIELAEQEQ